MEKMLVTEELDEQIIESLQNDGESLLNMIFQKLEDYSEEYCASAFGNGGYSSEEYEDLKTNYKNQLHEFVKSNL